MSDSSGPVRVEIDGGRGVSRVTLNRPDKLNALNDEVRAALRRRAGWPDRDDVQVVVVAGAGRAFSAGADLAERVDVGPTRWPAAGRPGAGSGCSTTWSTCPR